MTTDPCPPAPLPAKRRSRGELDAAYRLALRLVAIIDRDLTLGIRHYWHCDGHLLTTLDQVVRAIIDRELREAA